MSPLHKLREERLKLSLDSERVGGLGGGGGELGRMVSVAPPPFESNFYFNGFFFFFFFFFFLINLINVGYRIYPKVSSLTLYLILLFNKSILLPVYVYKIAG